MVLAALVLAGPSAGTALLERGGAAEARVLPSEGAVPPPAEESLPHAWGAERGPSQPRRFSHERHEAIACTRCHGSGERHGTLLVRSAEDCAACHHAPGAGRACTHCHGTTPLSGGMAVERALHLSVWPSPRLRRLPFDHELHTGVSCVECHGPSPAMEMRRECGSCHERHHTAGAECTACHPAPAAEAHPASAHLTCAGAGCHLAMAAPVPTLSRALCLTCHVERRLHEPGESCSGCHAVPDPLTAAGGRLTGAAPEGGGP